MDDQVNKIINSLTILEKYYDDVGYGTKKHVKSESGILIPTTALLYRIIFDHFERSFLDSFIKLYKEIAANVHNTPALSLLSVRTIVEMSKLQSPIFFAANSEIRYNSRFYAWLVDIVGLAASPAAPGDEKKNWLSDINKVYKDEEKNLDKDIHALANDIIKNLNDTKQIDIAKLRQNYGRYMQKQSKLVDQREIDSGIFSETNIRIVASYFNHTLHGSTLSISELFLDSTKSSRVWRTQVVLILWGTYLCWTISEVTGIEEHKNAVVALIKELKSILPGSQPMNLSKRTA